MLLSHPERFNFYKVENEAKKGFDKLVKYIEEVLVSHDLELVIGLLKSSGIAVDIFGSKKHKKVFNDLINYLYTKLNDEEKVKLDNLVMESTMLEGIIRKFIEMRSNYFDSYEEIEDRYKTVSYLLSLEEYLSSLDASTSHTTNNFNQKFALWDSTIESTGMILKYFMFNEYEFSGNNKTIDPLFLEVSKNHIIFSAYWNEINDLLEYWKYSDLRIVRNENDRISFEIIDSEFELNNLVSNERFVNLREGWQMSALGEKVNKLKETNKKEDTLSEITDRLTYLFATLYFGSPTLEDKIENITLSKWIQAYQLLIIESKNFLNRNIKRNNNKIKEMCLSRTKKVWKEFFKNNGFTTAEFETILNLFTFNSKSQDLIDCPFVKIDDQFIIIPSLAAHADAARALASNFLNKNINLALKGPGFEDRIKAGFKIRKIKYSGLYKKVEDTEYQCDVAFVIENDIFFVECKAHVQPYTTRQHANHLYKLYEETFQLNRIADYFSGNIPLVKEQLKLSDDFIVNNMHRILITTSMLGTPLYINGVHIIDESSFTKFIDRNPPSLMWIKDGEYKRQHADKFDIYKGSITVNKMIDLLNSPPQIEISKEFYSKAEKNLNLFDFKRNTKIHNTIYIGDEINNLNQALVEKFYVGKIE